MTRVYKHILMALIAIAVGFVGIDSAHARNAGVVKNTYRLIEKDYARLQVIKQQIDGFPVKDPYCQSPHPDTKQAALDHLKSIYEKRVSPTSSYRGRRTALHNFVLADGLGGALDSVAPGGTAAMEAGTFWNKYENLITALDSSYASQKAAITRAKTKKCALPAGSTPVSTPSATPAIAAPDPLAGITTSIDFKDVVVPTSYPDKFCSQDEKDQLLYHLRQLRFDAHLNAVKAGNLETELREKLAQLKSLRERAFDRADAAAKSGDAKALGELTTKYQEHKAAADAAETSFPNLIKKAAADKSKWRGIVDAIDADISKVKATPVVDCSNGASLTDPLSGTAFPDVYKHVDNISLRSFELLTIDIAKTCFQRVKESYQMNASTQLSNARSNLSDWNIRLGQVGGHHDLLSHDASASADLVENMRKARVEARAEVAKWTKIVAQAEAVKAQADAIIVEDCSNAGGETEIGRLDPGFDNISSDIPTPDLKPYDLPAIPARICSWSELEALRARAAEAREVSAHNRSEWGKRLTALGKLLFTGPNAQAYPMGPEYAAHLDAQRQYDYWNAQQDVAHKVYWDLMARKHEDCSDADKNVSIGNDFNTGGSNLGALQDAINNQPVMNGGANNGYGGMPSGRDCIIQQGGCFYPDPRNDWMYQSQSHDRGFDGSEAENALHHTLDHVQPRHDDRRDEYRGTQGDAKSPYAQPHSDRSPTSGGASNYDKPVQVNGSGGASNGGKSMPVDTDSATTDTPSSPTPGGVPVPYRAPGTTSGMSNGTPNGASKGAANSGGSTAPVDTPLVDTRPINIPSQPCYGQRTCGTSAVRFGSQTPTVLTVPNKLGTGRAAPTLNIPSNGGNNGGNNGGAMIQVAPPTLIINSQGQQISPNPYLQQPATDPAPVQTTDN